MLPGKRLPKAYDSAANLLNLDSYTSGSSGGAPNMQRLGSTNSTSTSSTLAPVTVPFRTLPFSRLFGSSQLPLNITEIDPYTGKPISSNVPHLKYTEAIQKHPEGHLAIARLTGKFPALRLGKKDGDREKVDKWPSAKWLLLLSVSTVCPSAVTQGEWADLQIVVFRSLPMVWPALSGH